MYVTGFSAWDIIYDAKEKKIVFLNMVIGQLLFYLCLSAVLRVPTALHSLRADFVCLLNLYTIMFLIELRIRFLLAYYG